MKQTSELMGEVEPTQEVEPSVPKREPEALLDIHIPKSLHMELYHLAQREGKSLNSLIVGFIKARCDSYGVN